MIYKRLQAILPWDRTIRGRTALRSCCGEIASRGSTNEQWEVNGSGRAFYWPHLNVKHNGDIIRAESSWPLKSNVYEFVRLTFIISNNEPCPKCVRCLQVFANGGISPHGYLNITNIICFTFKSSLWWVWFQMRVVQEEWEEVEDSIWGLNGNIKKYNRE